EEAVARGLDPEPGWPKEDLRVNDLGLGGKSTADDEVAAGAEDGDEDGRDQRSAAEPVRTSTLPPGGSGRRRGLGGELARVRPRSRRHREAGPLLGRRSPEAAKFGRQVGCVLIPAPPLLRQASQDQRLQRRRDAGP